MPKYKIVVCATAYHPFIGGAEIAIQEVAGRLGSEADFLILTSRFDRSLPVVEKRPEAMIRRIGFGARWDKWLLPVAGLAAFWNEKRKTKEDTRMVLWGMDISQGALLASCIKFFFSVPFVLTVQYGEDEKRLSRGRLGFLSLSFRWMLLQADAVTAISSYLLKITRDYGFLGPVRLIPNGVDIMKFKNQEGRSKNPSVAKAMEGKQGKKVVITTSRLVHKNGIDTLIRGIAEIKKTKPDVECWIIGDGPLRTELQQLTGKLGVEKEVIFFGALAFEKIPEYLHKADIFIRPSRSEGMGNSFVEALAAGLPIIGTHVGGIPDIITDGETGLFCKADNPASLADAALRLLRDPNLAARIVHQGREMIANRFEWSLIARSYANEFRRQAAYKTRILVATGLFPPDIGGPATYSRLLLDELPKHGVHVRVLSFGSVRALPSGIRHVAYALMLTFLAKGKDIIYAQDPVSVGVPAAVISKIVRKKFLLKVVGDYAWEQGMQRFGVTDLLDDFLKKKYGWQVRLLRYAEYRTARRAVRIITPSEYLKRVVEQWGIESKKITVIPNAFEIPAVMQSHDDARRKLKLTGTVVLSAGRMVPWKGFETLIEAVADLHNQIPDIRLIVAGSGPLKASLDARIKSRGSIEYIQMPGALGHSEFLEYMRASDMFVLNTGYEGFSHVLLEALAAEVPVITTPVGGNPEVIQDNENGLLVPYNDKERLQEAIMRIVGMSESEQTRMKTHAAKTVQRFNVQTLVDHTARLVRDAAQGIT